MKFLIELIIAFFAPFFGGGDSNNEKREWLAPNYNPPTQPEDREWMIPPPK